MKVIPVDYKDINELSKRDVAFIEQNDDLTPFVKRWASIEAFKNVIKSKEMHKIDRALLKDTLLDQYKTIETSAAVTDNINALAEANCFTIITAHQPSLFTGPLYYFYKICSVINLTKQLKQAYPEYNFVPIFISGGEDHDFEEINHLHIYNNDIVWNRESTGPVGRLSTDGLAELIAEIKDILGSSDHAEMLVSLLESSLAASDQYADVNFRLINELFKDYGLVYANMDNAAYKRRLIPIIKDELRKQSSYTLVNETLEKLSDIGYKSQATPREINLFYLKDDIRERIIQNGDRYIVNNTEISFSSEEIMALVDDSPELFSPNVLLRPLYQETIFPNLAYIGGGGEIAYWVERASQFNHYDIPFPLLIRRNSVMQVNRGAIKQISKTNYDIVDFIKPDQNLINNFLKVHVSEDIDLSDYKEKIEALYEEIAEKAKAIQEPLSKFVLAESTKQIKAVDNIESKLKKALKSKNEIDINRLTSIRSKLFPNGGLQERYENFMMYYAQHGPEWIEQLVEHLDPLNAKFLLMVDEHPAS